MIIKIEANCELVDRTMRILEEKIPNTINDKLELYQASRAIMNDIFEYKEIYFQKATKYLLEKPYETITIILDEELEKCIGKLFARQQEIFRSK